MDFIILACLTGWFTVFPFILAMLGFLHLRRSRSVGGLILLVAVPSIVEGVNTWAQLDLIVADLIGNVLYGLMGAQFVVMALRGLQTMRESVSIFEKILVWIQWAILVPTPYSFWLLSKAFRVY